MEGFSLMDEYTEDLAVGRLVTDKGEEIGSAVLIAPSVILTAGHCMQDGDIAEFVTGCERYKIAAYKLHPLFKVQQHIFMDLAVAVLDRPCCVEPVRFLNTETNRYEQGEPLTVIGFGGGYKRHSHPEVFTYYGTLIEDPTAFKFLPLEGTVYFGDSGGAVLDGKGVLVGIVSALGYSNGHIYENSATRLDLASDWVKNTTLELSGVPLEVAP
jgi:S1-C subfamily serine protease